MVVDFCIVCYGCGCIFKFELVKVKLFKGIDEGYCICVVGQGNEGFGGNGDFYVYIEMELYFELYCQDENLIFFVCIGFVMVVFGGCIQVFIFDGLQEVEVKFGIQYGEFYCLCGQGMFWFQGVGMGDLIVDYEIVVFKYFNVEVKDVL